jgi:hypothetical protein
VTGAGSAEEISPKRLPMASTFKPKIFTGRSIAVF